MKHLTLRQQLLLLTLLPSLLIAIALVAYFTFSGSRALEGELRTRGLAIARHLATISEYGLIAGQQDNLNTLTQATMQEDWIKAVVIVGRQGRVIAVGGKTSLSPETLRQALEAPRLIAEDARLIAFGAPVLRSTTEVDNLFADAPAAAEKAPPAPPIGHVFIELDKGELQDRQGVLWQRGLLIVYCGLLVLGTLAIAMADHLTRPVLCLVEAIRQMSAGQLDARVDAGSSGELGILEQGFNEMATRIQEAQQSLQARLEETTAQLAYQAGRDTLTGLLNRQEFNQRLEEALFAVRAGGEACCLLFIDFDCFKPINDQCGHQAGDAVLQQIAQLLQGRLREGDTLARVGGDEFAVLLANCGLEQGRQVAETLCQRTAAYRFIWQDKVFAIGASLGLSPLTPQIERSSEVLAAAEQACRNARAAGRNQFRELAAQGLPERRNGAGNSWAAHLGRAIAREHLSIGLSPTLALQGTPPGALLEVTARLEEPGYPSVPLPTLIDAAGRHELSHLIDDRLLRAAFNTLRVARQAGRCVSCLVPLSGAALGRPALLDDLAQQLREQPLGDNRLLLMLSEADVVQRSRQAEAFAAAARDLGCAIALQEFGGNLESLALLHSLAPACVKLSRSLTRQLGGNRVSTALLRAVQEVTADQGIATLADGAATAAAIEQLRAIGIDYAGGKAVGDVQPAQLWQP